jgi:hypothetical protein
VVDMAVDVACGRGVGVAFDEAGGCVAAGVGVQFDEGGLGEVGVDRRGR